MPFQTFLWTEDRKDKSGYIFWKTLMQQLFPEVIVESKRNNSELIKAVKAIKDVENRYIIMFDNSFDNLQVYQEQKKLKQYAEQKENVRLMNIVCFEYILLEFDKLIEWIYAPDDEFLIKRARAIQARKKLVEALTSENVDYKILHEIIEYDPNIHQHNIEQLSAKLLFDLTRNTGFEVSKSTLGVCWTKSCCDWETRQQDDICGLDSERLSIYKKMKAILAGTSLEKKFSNIGLEVPE